jgi:hypothetical protein
MEQSESHWWGVYIRARDELRGRSIIHSPDYDRVLAVLRTAEFELTSLGVNLDAVESEADGAFERLYASAGPRAEVPDEMTAAHLMRVALGAAYGLGAR